MILNKLIISKRTGKIIREVPFRMGANIIVNKAGEKTGNSIGKTTLSRSIDFCLGSEGEDIYKDKEFKADNIEVKNYLQTNNVLFELEIKIDGTLHRIRRSFQNDILIIDNTNFSEESNSVSKNLNSFRNFIYKNFFLLGDNISGRNLLKKFIRNNSDNKENTLYFLPDRTKKSIYEYLHLFLFKFADIDLLALNFSLGESLKKIDNERLLFYRRYGNIDLKKAELSMKQIDVELKSKEDLFDTLKIKNLYDDAFKGIADLKREISKLSTRKAIIESKIISITSNLDFLTKKRTEQNPKDIKDLYESAKIYIGNINKEFEELIEFHNKMVNSKISYLIKQTQVHKAELKNINPSLEGLLLKEEELIKIFGTKDYLDDIKIIAKQLSELSEKRGELKKIADSLGSIQNDLDEKTQEKNSVDDKIKDFLGNLDSKIALFNQFFSDYSKRIYGESYILTYSVPEGRKKYYEFSIGNTLGNEGTGKKKGQISAFDLAYIEFLNQLGEDNLPRFIIYDGIEEIDGNQIKEILDIAESLNGQYIVGVLYDKIKGLGDEYIEQKRILELSETNKFFRF